MYAKKQLSWIRSVVTVTQYRRVIDRQTHLHTDMYRYRSIANTQANTASCGQNVLFKTPKLLDILDFIALGIMLTLTSKVTGQGHKVSVLPADMGLQIVRVCPLSSLHA